MGSLNYTERGEPSSIDLSASSTCRMDNNYLFPNYEAECIDKIPEAIKKSIASSISKDDFDESSVHQAMAAIMQLGTEMTFKALDPNDPLTSIEGRMATFPPTWTGPRPLTMAVAGFYHDSETGRVRCVWCSVSFRCLDQLEQCPWKEHCNIVPFCLQLVKYVSQGPAPKPSPIRRRRILSDSAGARMMTHTQKMTASYDVDEE